MHPKYWGVVVFACLVIAILYPVYSVDAHQLRPAAEAGELSPYWPAAVQQWEEIILQESYRRGLDPDLVAALIWKESRGIASSRGPVGAVGLMMLMPQEAGFSWRPPVAELRDPQVNVFWGTRALSTVIRQSDGDLYNALSAYNGGWGQIQYRGPRIFANDIMNDYARAIAVRHGLSPEGHWVATIAPLDGAGPMTVVGPGRELVRYSRPPIMADIPDCTTDGSPTAVAFESVDGLDLGSRVGIWILMDDAVVGEEGRFPQASGRSGASRVSLAPALRFP